MGNKRTGGGRWKKLRNRCLFCGYFVRNRLKTSLYHKDCARGYNRYKIGVDAFRRKMVDKRIAEGAEK